MELKLSNDILTQQCVAFNFLDPQVDPVDLSNSMTLFREEHKGIGLAANQVGLPYRVISVKGFESALFNPRIVDQTTEMVLMEEGCLSFPGLVVKVKRPKVIRVRYTTALGVTETKRFMDMTARVICHEIDHIDGVLFYERAHPFHKEQAFRKWTKYKKALK